MSKPNSALLGLFWPIANLATATVIGGLAAGQVGALLGFGAGLVLGLIPSFARLALSGGRQMRGPISRAKVPAKAAALWLGSGLVAVANVVQRASGVASRLTPPLLPAWRVITACLGSMRSFLARLFSEQELPKTLTNLLMAIVLGCGLFGIKFAFYLAVVATPTLVFVLLQSAVEAGETPLSKPE